VEGAAVTISCRTSLDGVTAGMLDGFFERPLRCKEPTMDSRMMVEPTRNGASLLLVILNEVKDLGVRGRERRDASLGLSGATSVMCHPDAGRISVSGNAGRGGARSCGGGRRMTIDAGRATQHDGGVLLASSPPRPVTCRLADWPTGRRSSTENPMPRLFRLQFDPDVLTDEMLAFVTDPSPSRNEREIVQELNDLHPESIDVLESMLLDGTEDRADVAAYVETVFVGELGR
jgi:hypothetical protein